MTRGKQIIVEAKRIIAEAHESGNNDPMVDLAITASFALGARWADKNPHWISVEDEMPKEKGWIIVSTFFNSQACPAYYYENDDVEEFRSQGITHWMPLPKAPTCSEKPNNCEKGGKE